MTGNVSAEDGPWTCLYPYPCPSCLAVWAACFPGAPFPAAGVAGAFVAPRCVCARVAPIAVAGAVGFGAAFPRRRAAVRLSAVAAVVARRAGAPGPASGEAVQLRGRDAARAAGWAAA